MKTFLRRYVRALCFAFGHTGRDVPWWGWLVLAFHALPLAALVYVVVSALLGRTP